MELLPFFSHKKVEEDHIFLALVITNVTVQAGLWRVADGILSIDSVSDVKPYTTNDSLLIAADSVLQQLGKDSEKTDTVVFGFELDWVDATGIIDAKKPMLKQLTTELSLKPSGFVVIPEALLHALQKEDPHCSVLLIQLAVHQLTVTLIKQGTILSSERVGRSDDVISDVTEAIARFNDEVLAGSLPGKMILAGIGLSDSALRELQQQLLTHPWAQHHTFIHPPVIEIVPEDMVIKSVIQEGGKAVVEAQGVKVQIAGTEIGSESAPTVSPTESQKPSEFDNEDSTPKETQLTLQSDSTQDDAHHPGQLSPDSDLLSDNLTQPFTHAPATESDHVSPAQTLAAVDSHTKFSGSTSPIPTGRTRTQRIKNWMFEHRVYILAGFFPGVVALIVIALAALFFSREAVVMVWLKNEFISKDIAVTLDSKIAQSQPESLVLKATTTTREVSGTDSLAASGVKQVGEKATGTVTIFNKTDSIKKFAAGTELRSGQLRFVLDSEVEVASASVSPSSSADSETRVFGKAEAKATAAKIGAESNIAANTDLQVGDFASSTYTAQTKTDFTGGASREVRVVSQEDRAKLLSTVKTTLLAQATQDFKKETTNGVSIIPTGKTNVIKSTYDAEVGEEVESVTLDLVLQIEAITYAQDDMKALVASVLQTQLPNGYTLVDQDPSILTDSSQKIATDTAKTKVTLDLNVSSQATPALDLELLKSQLAGKVVSQAESILASTQGISKHTITLYPWPLRFVLKSIPKNTGAITIEIQASE